MNTCPVCPLLQRPDAARQRREEPPHPHDWVLVEQMQRAYREIQVARTGDGCQSILRPVLQLVARQPPMQVISPLRNEANWVTYKLENAKSVPEQMRLFRELKWHIKQMRALDRIRSKIMNGDLEKLSNNDKILECNKGPLENESALFEHFLEHEKREIQEEEEMLSKENKQAYLNQWRESITRNTLTAIEKMEFENKFEQEWKDAKRKDLEMIGLGKDFFLDIFQKLCCGRLKIGKTDNFSRKI